MNPAPPVINTLIRQFPRKSTRSPPRPSSGTFAVGSNPEPGRSSGRMMGLYRIGPAVSPEARRLWRIAWIASIDRGFRCPLCPVPPGGAIKAMRRAAFLASLLMLSHGAGPARGQEVPTRWHDVRDLIIEGKGWTDTKVFFDRLPAKAEGIVRREVWGLSRDSAGLCIRFATDATTISARWSLTSTRLAMPHMPATGVSGLDLYVRSAAGWRWLAVGQPERARDNSAVLVKGLPPGRREYLLYLPLYNGVSSVEVGVPGKSKLEKGPARAVDRRKPIVFYGTSITQGGCASRPGMAHVAIVGRHLDRPVINLGFSGNGLMEPELAALLAELDPAVYVLDCLPNMTAKLVSERVEPFVKTLRKAHPTTPIVLAEDRTYSNASIVPAQHERNATSRAELKSAYDRLMAQGVDNLYYLPGDIQLGADGEDTVDGSHPTDL